MSEAEIELLKQIEEDLRELERGQKALQNQISAIISTQLLTNKSLLDVLNCHGQEYLEVEPVNRAICGLEALKSSIDRRSSKRHKR